jgi:tetratricopeptide (TPR) repeat protein
MASYVFDESAVSAAISYSLLELTHAMRTIFSSKDEEDQRKGMVYDNMDLTKCCDTFLKYWGYYKSKNMNEQDKAFFQSAIVIRNRISHQTVDFQENIQDVGMLQKLALLIDRRDVVDKIQECLGRLQQSDPSLEELLEMGKTKFEQQQWKEALSVYNEAILSDYHDSEVYYRRALCCLEVKLYMSAIIDAEIALILKPDSPKLFSTLAQALVGLRQYREASIVCEKGLKVDKGNEELLTWKEECEDYIKYFDYMRELVGDLVH